MAWILQDSAPTTLGLGFVPDSDGPSTIGATVSGLVVVTAGNRAIIRPGAAGAHEWIIHNIFTVDSADLEFADGTWNRIVADQAPVGGRWWENLQFHVSNARYIMIKNTGVADRIVGWTGIVSV